MSADARSPFQTLLAIESAISGGSLSLVRPGEASASTIFGGAGVRAEALLRGIDESLNKSGLSRYQLDAIAVSVGPGSFTGLRIGMSTAMGLAAALGRPCIQVPLFEAIAARMASRPSVAVLPLGRSDLCFQRFDGKRGVGDPQAGTKEDLLNNVSSNQTKVILFHSDLSELVSAAGLPGHIQFIDIGRNMAEYVGLYALSPPVLNAEGPIYVQNPRFC